MIFLIYAKGRNRGGCSVPLISLAPEFIAQLGSGYKARERNEKGLVATLPSPYYHTVTPYIPEGPKGREGEKKNYVDGLSAKLPWPAPGKLFLPLARANPNLSRTHPAGFCLLNRTPLRYVHY